MKEKEKSAFHLHAGNKCAQCAQNRIIKVRVVEAAGQVRYGGSYYLMRLARNEWNFQRFSTSVCARLLLDPRWSDSHS